MNHSKLVFFIAGLLEEKMDWDLGDSHLNFKWRRGNQNINLKSDHKWVFTDLHSPAYQIIEKVNKNIIFQLQQHHQETLLTLTIKVAEKVIFDNIKITSETE